MRLRVWCEGSIEALGVELSAIDAPSRFVKWSWRDLNPRPNEELISFLHAYLRFSFRLTPGPKPPSVSLFSVTLPLMRDRE